MTPRKTLTLSQPLTPKTLTKIALNPPLSEMQKRSIEAYLAKLNRIKGAVKWLCQQYPKCFNTVNPHPLKLNIEADIFADYAHLPQSEGTPSKNCLRQALKYYTHSIRYLESHAQHSQRINCQGAKVAGDEVTLAQQAYALRYLAQVRQRLVEKGQRHSKPHNSHSKFYKHGSTAPHHPNTKHAFDAIPPTSESYKSKNSS